MMLEWINNSEAERFELWRRILTAMKNEIQIQAQIREDEKLAQVLIGCMNFKVELLGICFNSKNYVATQRYRVAILEFEQQ